MSNERVEISLIGAETYGTLTTVFQKGTPHQVTLAVWEFLKNEVNPSTGATLFCLTADLPAEPEPASNDISTADLRVSGLLGEIDTGLGPVENKLSDMDLSDPPQLPLVDADGEEFPSGAPDGSEAGETTLTSVLSEDAPKADSDASTAPAAETAAAPQDAAAAPRKVTIGKASTKAVQV